MGKAFRSPALRVIFPRRCVHAVDLAVLFRRAPDDRHRVVCGELPGVLDEDLRRARNVRRGHQRRRHHLDSGGVVDGLEPLGRGLQEFPAAVADEFLA